jgi:hypothetical protein
VKQFSFSDAEESGTKKSRKELKSKAAKVKILRAELQAMLDKPLMMRGLSAKYITTRGRVGFVDQLAGGTSELLSFVLVPEKTNMVLTDVRLLSRDDRSFNVVGSREIFGVG